MTLVLIGKGLFSKSCRPKIEDKQVAGTHMYIISIYIYIHMYTHSVCTLQKLNIYTKVTNCNVFQNPFKKIQRFVQLPLFFVSRPNLEKIQVGRRSWWLWQGKLQHTSNFQPREMTKKNCKSWNTYHINCCMTLLNQHYPQFKKHPRPTWRWTVRRDPDQPHPTKPSFRSRSRKMLILVGPERRAGPPKWGDQPKEVPHLTRKSEISTKQWTNKSRNKTLK